MQSPKRDFRAPIDRIRSHKSARRIAATASIATVGIIGSTVGSAPASAAAPAATPTPATTPTAAIAAAPAVAATPAIKPVAKLVASYTSVTPGQTVSFAMTERTTAGTPISSASATFYVHGNAGWQKVATKTLSAAGAATFTYRPSHTHAYRVDVASVTDGIAVYNAAATSSITVKTDIGAALVAAAAQLQGKPYRFGAAGPSAFDCSGLTKYVFAKFGITLPHLADAQRSHGIRVTRANARPGDLVFVMSGSYASHVAIYAGNGMWWEAPHAGAAVRKVKIWSSNVEFRRVR